MITVFNTKDNDNYKKIIDVNEIKEKDISKTWIHLTKPTDEEISKISELTDINKNLLVKSLDEEEYPHIEKEDNTTLICVDTVYEEEAEGLLKYNTLPFSILVNENFIVTTTLKEELYIDEIVIKYQDNLTTNKKITLILMIMYYNARHFIKTLKKIESITKKIEEDLNETMKNEGLMEMLNLSTSLVYLSTSINSNLLVVQKLEKIEQFKEYESDVELLEDAVIETIQAKETCSIYREVLSAKMDAYANIINNNVNKVMKILAVVTMVVTVPTLVSSIYGMNVTLPLQENENGFAIVMCISVVLTIISSIVLLKYSSKTKGK